MLTLSVPPLVMSVVGFLSAQRFLLPDISAYACLLPIILLLLPGEQTRHARTLVLGALLASVDLGGGVYAETPGGLRFLLYLAVGVTLLGRLGATPRGIVAIVCYLAIVFFNTILNRSNIDAYTFVRDVLTLVLVLLVILARNPEGRGVIDYQLLTYFCIGVLLSELVNILIFYTLAFGEYLNYSSFKCLILIPSLYFLLARRFALFLFFASLALVVTTAYASRMLLLTYLLVVMLALLRDVGRRTWQLLLVSVVVGLAVALLIAKSGIDLEGYRIFSIFLLQWDGIDVEGILAFLDPIRYGENRLFFSRDIVSLLFGDGLGAGIHDVTGQFAFVPDDGAAFSSRELSESRFYRFHDNWVWFGLRFGLLAYLTVLGWLLWRILSADRFVAMSACAALLFLFNSTFSVGGLLVCAAFALQCRRHNAVKHNQV